MGLRPAFQRFCSIKEQHINAMWILRKPTLEEVCLSRAAMENSVWGNVCRGFATRYPYEIFNEQEREKWKQFEERICMDDKPVQQQFDRFIKMLQHNRNKLKAKIDIAWTYVSKCIGHKEHIFGRNFWWRSYEKLDKDSDMKAWFGRQVHAGPWSKKSRVVIFCRGQYWVFI